MVARLSYSYCPVLAFFPIRSFRRNGDNLGEDSKIEARTGQSGSKVQAASSIGKRIEEYGENLAEGLEAIAGKKRHTDIFAGDFFTR